MGDPLPTAGPPSSLWGAMMHPWSWRMAWRDSRTQRQRMAIFGLSIVSGIAALVAIHGLKAKMEEGIENEAKSLLGCDIQVSSREAFPPASLEAMRVPVAELSTQTSFASMMSFPRDAGARLVQARGFSGNFPYYGTVKTEPESAWEEVKRDGGVILDPGLMRQYDVQIGDNVRLGQAEFAVRGEITKALPRGGRFSGFAPEAYLREADLASTGLLGLRSLVDHHVHVKTATSAAASQLKKEWRKAYATRPWRFETPEDRRESLEEALSALQQFLGIVAMVALVLGAMGVAGAVQAHIRRRVGTIAILRCMGCGSSAAYAIFLIQVLVMAVAGTLIGTVLGLALLLGVLSIFRDMLPFGISLGVPWQVVLQTSLAGFALCTVFAMVPLRRIGSIPPSRALQSGGEMPAGSLWKAWPLFLLATIVVFILAHLNSPNLKQAAGLTIGLFVAFAVLAAMAKLMMRLAQRMLRENWPYWMRQGVSNLYRPLNQTWLFLFSLGLSVFLLLFLVLSRDLVMKRVDLTGLKESPGMYLVDVQPDQVEGVVGLLGKQGMPVLESAPMISMRLKSVNGVPVADLIAKGTGPRWVYTREFRSTYRNGPNSTEKILAGTWHESPLLKPDEVAVSLEKKIAKDLEIGVGDTMVIDVQGMEINARVTSLREVDWSRFNLNFFMIFPPAAMEGAPAFHVVTTRDETGSSAAPMQNALVKEFPNVSVIDLSMMLETVAGILGKLAMVVNVLAGFTLLAGVAILVGSFLNGKDQRVRESVLLRTLGSSQSVLSRILLTEYAALGILSAATGIALAQISAVLLAIFAFKTSPVWSPFATVTIGLAAVALSVLAGMLTSRGVVRHSPLSILRQS